MINKPMTPYSRHILVRVVLAITRVVSRAEQNVGCLSQRGYPQHLARSTFVR